MDFFHWSQQSEAVRRGCLWWPAGKNWFSKRQRLVPQQFSERKMWKGVLTLKPTRGKCVMGLSLGREREEEMAALMVSLYCGRRVRSVPAVQGSLNWIIGTFVCLSTFPLTWSKGFLSSQSQAEENRVLAFGFLVQTESIQMYFRKQEHCGYLGHCSAVATTLSFL